MTGIRTPPAAALLPLAAVAALAEVPANWSVESGPDPVTYETVAALHLESLGTIPDEYASKEVRPRLELRCLPDHNGSISVRINWGRFISSFNTEVGFKVDDKELILLNLGVDKSNRITMTRAASDDQRLMEYLAGGRRLRIEVIPYSESLVTVDYDITGFANALAALEARCRP